jgi:hypothetical protein
MLYENTQESDAKKRARPGIPIGAKKQAKVDRDRPPDYLCEQRVLWKTMEEYGRLWKVDRDLQPKVDRDLPGCKSRPTFRSTRRLAKLPKKYLQNYASRSTWSVPCRATG